MGEEREKGEERGGRGWRREGMGKERGGRRKGWREVT